jgi:2-hydroxy-6-oxonona-2,4-dienedioate hydrolase
MKRSSHDRILPVSAPSSGLRSDSVLAPTLIVNVRDGGFGTYASAAYTTGQIKDAKFVGYERGGHVLVGHNEEVMNEIVDLLLPWGSGVKH